MKLQKEHQSKIPFDRIRRVTGYLVGDKNKRFNDAKQAEERDRVKHIKVDI